MHDLRAGIDGNGFADGLTAHRQTRHGGRMVGGQDGQRSGGEMADPPVWLICIGQVGHEGADIGMLDDQLGKLLIVVGLADADAVDEIVFEEMQKKLAEFKTLVKQKQDGCNLHVIKLKTRIDAIDDEISSLVDKIAAANETVMQYINNRVAELDAEKKELCAQITQLDNDRKANIGEIGGYTEHWDELSISDKITVVDCLIERITASKESIEIKWKI